MDNNQESVNSKISDNRIALIEKCNFWNNSELLILDLRLAEQDQEYIRIV